MLKLVRNSWAADKVIIYENSKIEWNFIEKLVSLQTVEGLKSANKLSSVHIHFHNKTMNVLSVKVLSKSVADSLSYMKLTNNIGFEEVEFTSMFCTIFNDA